MSSTLPTKSAWKVKVWSSQAKTRQRSFKRHLVVLHLVVLQNCAPMCRLEFSLLQNVVSLWQERMDIIEMATKDMRFHLHFANL